MGFTAKEIPLIFYTGLHMINHAYAFDHCFISINRLRKRRSSFAVSNWIIDSGAFTELLQHGRYRSSPNEYVDQIRRWQSCGNLEMAVTQDYMCEPFMLQQTGLTVAEHQQLTIQRYDELVKLSPVTIMPVLQGYAVGDYLKHLKMYSNRLSYGTRVGVGSICKRNGSPKEIINILQAIKAKRPDLKLHGFGLKLTSLTDTYIRNLLYSADSMAWSYAARRNGLNANGLPEALRFANRIEEMVHEQV